MGDPSCPVYVRDAKQIFKLIKEEMDMLDGEGGDNGAVGGDNGRILRYM